MEENLPPGFRFHPTDEELITYYLSSKVSDFGFTSRAVTDVDLNKCEPWDLPAKASMGEKEWYFFSMRDRKYPTGMRTNRATESGYWKTTGKDKEIFRDGVLVGMKKTLVFYKGRAPKGEKTNWVMHEYRLESKLPFKTSKDEWVVCRVFQKSAIVKKPHQTPSSPQSLESPCDTNTIANELSDIELPNFNTLAANPSSNGILSNISPQNFTTDNFNNAISWAAIREAAATALPSLSWPSSSLLSTTNLAMNTTPLLLRALQLRNFQPAAGETTTATDYSFMPQGMISNQLANDFSSNLGASSSSNRVLDQQQQLQEQSFNLDSNIW
ncbi:hypothetical protein ACH5RR_024964 [Cinchona calisaya]|uniref:NAC domain-containing protein n=1 Tax=Cinchona calisaya TaxID=153742 RepID=A0ABD2YY99_9GENT